MVVGGSPAHKRTVVTLSVGGVVFVVTVALGLERTSCRPVLPLDVPTLPTPEVEGSPDESARPPTCDFTSPRGRARRIYPRIVGGSSAQTGAFPFTVAIATSGRQHYCGGSIISNEWLVSAAHCMIEPGDLVLIGSNDLREARMIRVSESRLHPSYDPQTFDFDVAIARLSEPARAPAIPLASAVRTDSATVVGWGRTCEGCPTTSVLQETTIPLWSDNDCRRPYPSLTERQVCAAPASGGKDACAGDSGSGLLARTANGWELVGITSYGIGCGRPGFPGVYTRVSAPEIRAWITACTDAR